MSQVAPIHPQRSAHRSIHGYLYQAALGVLRWLSLEDGELLICEGDEDLDRIVLDDAGKADRICEQVKAYSDSITMAQESIRDTVGWFVATYAARRERGDTMRFVFTTTADLGRQTTRNHGLEVDVLAEWNNVDRRDKVVDSLRAVAAHHTDAVAWMDAKEGRWSEFIESVEWTFNEPDLSVTLGQIEVAIAMHPLTKGLPAQTLATRLLSELLKASTNDEAHLRTRSREDLRRCADTTQDELLRWLRTPTALALLKTLDDLERFRKSLRSGSRPTRTGANLPPSMLLTAAHEVVPFDDGLRQPELQTLAEWCNDSAAQSVWLLTGEGGSGKTRLAIEWCRRLSQQGWVAGFLDEKATVESLRDFEQGATYRLVVIDYAETRLVQVRELLRIAAQAGPAAPRLRVLLLARNVGIWWPELGESGSAVRELLAVSRRPSRVHEVPLDDLARRRSLVETAIRALSEALKKSEPALPSKVDFGATEFGRPLFLHMAALSLVEGRELRTPAELLDETLKNEARFWHGQIDELNLSGMHSRPAKDACPSLVAALTLCGGTATGEAAERLINRVAPKLGRFDAGLPEALARVLYNLYPGESADDKQSSNLQPLTPDLLGERLIEHQLDKNRDLLESVFEGNDASQLRHGFTVLTRIAMRRQNAMQWLVKLLSADLASRVGIAIDVAIEQGEQTAFSPLGDAIAVALEGQPSDEVARQVLERTDRIPNSVSLAVVSVSAGLIRANFLRETELSSEGERAEFARVLNNLGNWYNASGRLEKALEVSLEAVSIRRELAHARPDAFRPALATVLNNLGNWYYALGRHEDALKVTLEAVNLRRELANARPNAFRPDLASALSNLGNTYDALGRREEALEVSLEAVNIRRDLAAARPDAFRRDLAIALNNLGVKYDALGRREEALEVTLEAVNILRELANARPDAFRPDLATALNNLGVRYYALGRREEALEVCLEVVNIRRDLAAARPDAFRCDLANALNNLGVKYYAQGRREEALEVTLEAVSIGRELANARPDAFRPDLATALNNLGIHYDALGRREEALEVSLEAVNIRRDLATARPDAFRSVLACSLKNLGDRLKANVRIAKAHSAYREAVELLSPIFLNAPAAHAERMRYMIEDYRASCAQLSVAADEALLAPVEQKLLELG